MRYASIYELRFPDDVNQDIPFVKLNDYNDFNTNCRRAHSEAYFNSEADNDNVHRKYKNVILHTDKC